jgi:hypothetical protein
MAGFLQPETLELVIFGCESVLTGSGIISAQVPVDELATPGVRTDPDDVARHFPGRSCPVVVARIRAEFGLDLPGDFEGA